MKSDFQQLHLDPTWTLALVRTGDAFRYQHVVQSHQLGVGRVLRVKVAVTEKKHLFLKVEVPNPNERSIAWCRLKGLRLHVGT